MKNTAVSKEEKEIRDAQRAAYKAAEWIRVTFANGRTRMLKRADYNTMKAGK